MTNLPAVGPAKDQVLALGLGRPGWEEGGGLRRQGNLAWLSVLLISLLVAFGSAVGGAPFYRVGGDRHTANLYVVLVGATSSGRKGTAWGNIRSLMELADAEWTKRILPGLSSGKGLIWAVRDPTEKAGQVVDEGVTDKRLLAYQSEFASTLRVLDREGNTLSPVMREAWDRGDLGTLTKASPARTTGAHVSLMGHVTKPELLHRFDSTEAANGWGNRILWWCARRSKLLPDGGWVPEGQAATLSKRLEEALDKGRCAGPLERTPEAAALWRDRYSDLTKERSGLFGAVTARSAAQVVRLSLVYALLDGARAVGLEHLKAALAVWQYAEDSARYIFGEATGDRTADRILGALRVAGEGGLTRTDLRDLFGRHKGEREIDRALRTLESARLAESGTEQSGGRPVERWVAG